MDVLVQGGVTGDPDGGQQRVDMSWWKQEVCVLLWWRKWAGSVPGMLQCLIAGVTRVGVFLHQVDDEIFGCKEQEEASA